MLSSRYCLWAMCLLLTFSACGPAGEPYLKYELETRKAADSCPDNPDINLSMISNTIGERYRFLQCITAGKEKDISVIRRGDTVEVNFDRSSKLATYEVTLDINTHPRYSTIILGGQSFTVVPTKN